MKSDIRMTDAQTLQLAEQALRKINFDTSVEEHYRIAQEALAAIEAERAQQGQAEPVAWQWKCGALSELFFNRENAVACGHRLLRDGEIIPLYAQPPRAEAEMIEPACEWRGRSLGKHDWIDVPGGKRCTKCKHEVADQQARPAPPEGEVQGASGSWTEEEKESLRRALQVIDDKECEVVKRACALGMAAIATYGRRDENGLAGLSKQHYRELSDLMASVSQPDTAVCASPAGTRGAVVTEEFSLWSFMRSVLDQGRSIEMDYQAGNHKTYEHMSARMDVAARERADELAAKFSQPEGEVVVTTDESGRCVAVTRQDEEHRILSVIWEAAPAKTGTRGAVVTDELVERIRTLANSARKGPVLAVDVYTTLEDAAAALESFAAKFSQPEK